MAKKQGRHERPIPEPIKECNHMWKQSTLPNGKIQYTCINCQYTYAVLVKEN